MIFQMDVRCEFGLFQEIIFFFKYKGGTNFVDGFDKSVEHL